MPSNAAIRSAVGGVGAKAPIVALVITSGVLARSVLHIAKLQRDLGPRLLGPRVVRLYVFDAHVDAHGRAVQLARSLDASRFVLLRRAQHDHPRSHAKLG